MEINTLHVVLSILCLLFGPGSFIVSWLQSRENLARYDERLKALRDIVSKNEAHNNEHINGFKDEILRHIDSLRGDVHSLGDKVDKLLIK